MEKKLETRPLILALLKPHVYFYDWTKENGTLKSQGFKFIQIKITHSSVPASDKSFFSEYCKNSTPSSTLWGRGTPTSSSITSMEVRISYWCLSICQGTSYVTFTSMSMNFLSYKIKRKYSVYIFSKAVANANDPLPSASDIPICCHFREQPIYEFVLCYY